MSERPTVIVLSGPNGAGKSTAATRLFPSDMIFVNADEVSKALPGYPSRAVDIQAGRLVLERMDQLEANRSSFAIETTLASRSLAPRVERLQRAGYRFRLIFVFVPDPRLSIERVAGRVRLGGHSVHEDTIRRRHAAGIRNFFSLYQPIANRWAVYDTMKGIRPRLIAAGRSNKVERIRRLILWKLMEDMSRE